MSDTAATLTAPAGRFSGGVHPPDRKELSRHMAIEVLPTPAVLNIPLLQHTGAPCRPIVAPRSEVAFGQTIAEAEAFISAPIHASVAGVVQREGVATLPNARHVKTLVIKTSPASMSADELLLDMYGGSWMERRPEDVTPEEIVRTVRAAGIVGLGGAAFPTHVKLSRNPDRPVDTLLVNGCECEPYLTADYRLMVEAPAPIMAGALLAARAAGATKIVVAIEDNKPEAIRAMGEVAGGRGASVMSMPTRYPMGGEKQTVRVATGRTIPTGGLPLDVGVVVINVGTAAAIARAVWRGKPLTHRVVTVTGGGVAQPRNLLAPIGASYGDLVQCCGGMKPEAARAVAGGPMMGFSLGTLEVPVTKGTSGLVILTAEDVAREAQTSCVRCGRCVETCPLDLMPTRLALASRHKDWALAKRHHLMACMECGCCAYACPAGLPLVQLIRMGKVQMMKEVGK
jgi:electron transport complex protein RnfC